MKLRASLGPHSPHLVSSTGPDKEVNENLPQTQIETLNHPDKARQRKSRRVGSSRII